VCLRIASPSTPILLPKYRNCTKREPAANMRPMAIWSTTMIFPHRRFSRNASIVILLPVRAAATAAPLPGIQAPVVRPLLGSSRTMRPGSARRAEECQRAERAGRLAAPAPGASGGLRHGRPERAAERVDDHELAVLLGMP